MPRITISQWELMEALHLDSESYANRRTVWNNAHPKTRQALINNGYIIKTTLTLSGRGYKYLSRLEGMLYTALNTPLSDAYLETLPE